MKDAYYFSHDSNARHDPKLIALIEKYGLVGYSYFFILIEIMREQKDYIFPKYLISALIKEWQTHGIAMASASDGIAPSEILKSMVELQLIEENENGYYSPSLIERMTYFDTIKKKRSDAGRAGAIALWQSQGKRMAKDGKERKSNKGKVIKESINTTLKKQFLDFVFLTDPEFKGLSGLLGAARLKDYVARLNDYIGSKGAKYKSHYHTILAWSRKDGFKPEAKRIDRPAVLDEPEPSVDQREALSKLIRETAQSMPKE